MSNLSCRRILYRCVFELIWIDVFTTRIDNTTLLRSINILNGVWINNCEGVIFIVPLLLMLLKFELASIVSSSYTIFEFLTELKIVETQARVEFSSDWIGMLLYIDFLKSIQLKFFISVSDSFRNFSFK